MTSLLCTNATAIKIKKRYQITKGPQSFVTKRLINVSIVYYYLLYNIYFSIRLSNIHAYLCNNRHFFYRKSCLNLVGDYGYYFQHRENARTM